MRKTLAPFQKQGVEFVLKKEGRAMIADEMGLGKTIQASVSSDTSGLELFKPAHSLWSDLEMLYLSYLLKVLDSTTAWSPLCRALAILPRFAKTSHYDMIGVQAKTPCLHYAPLSFVGHRLLPAPQRTSQSGLC